MKGVKSNVPAAVAGMKDPDTAELREEEEEEEEKRGEEKRGEAERRRGVENEGP